VDYVDAHHYRHAVDVDFQFVGVNVDDGLVILSFLAVKESGASKFVSCYPVQNLVYVHAEKINR
jgi:hypothetical protein